MHYPALFEYNVCLVTCPAMRQKADAPYHETEHIADCQHAECSPKTHGCAAMGLSPGPPLLDDLENFLLGPRPLQHGGCCCMNEAAHYVTHHTECLTPLITTHNSLRQVQRNMAHSNFQYDMASSPCAEIVRHRSPAQHFDAGRQYPVQDGRIVKLLLNFWELLPPLC